MPAIPYPEPQLRDDVAALRPFTEDDAAAIVAGVQDPEVPRWTVIPSPYGESDAREFLAGVEPGRKAGEALGLAIVSAHGDELLGGTGLLNLAWDHRRAEAGYWVAAGARGRSIGTRALRLLSRWALTDLGLERVELLVNPGNEASERLAEAAGFTREGLLRSYRVRKGKREDFLVFSLIRADLE
jgi:RimJ/RimL family protein N-acetyltransferase